jgi:hypothetical protein
VRSCGGSSVRPHQRCIGPCRSFFGNFRVALLWTCCRSHVAVLWPCCSASSIPHDVAET